MIPASLCYPYPECNKFVPIFRSRAAQQLLAWYEQVRDRTKYNEMLWGDELEFMIVSIDSVKRQVKLSLSTHSIIDRIRRRHTAENISDDDEGVSWFSEYANYNLEAQSDDDHLNGNMDMSNEYAALSLDQIFNGEANGFVGLIPLIHRYLDGKDLKAETRQKLNKCLDLVQGKANGTELTAAQRIREFVLNPPSYQKDSYVSEEINYDLINHFFG